MHIMTTVEGGWTILECRLGSGEWRIVLGRSTISPVGPVEAFFTGPKLFWGIFTSLGPAVHF